MEYKIRLHNYKGTSILVDIDDEIVEDLYLVLRYTVSGDEVYLFITDEGMGHTFDAMDYVPGSPRRTIDCGPEDITIIFPEDMKWEKVNAA